MLQGYIFKSGNSLLNRKAISNIKKRPVRPALHAVEIHSSLTDSSLHLLKDVKRTKMILRELTIQT